jgi:hypothetical protein
LNAEQRRNGLPLFGAVVARQRAHDFDNCFSLRLNPRYTSCIRRAGATWRNSSPFMMRS